MNNLLKAMDKVVESAVAAIFAAMVIVGAAQIFYRYVLGGSLGWSHEFQRFAHIWLVFIVIPIAYNYGAHIGMNIISNKFPPRMHYGFELVIHSVWFLFGLGVIVYTLDLMEIAQRQTSSSLQIPMHYVYSVFLFSGGYTMLVAVRKVIKRLRVPVDQRIVEAGSLE